LFDHEGAVDHESSMTGGGMAEVDRCGLG